MPSTHEASLPESPARVKGNYGAGACSLNWELNPDPKPHHWKQNQPVSVSLSLMSRHLSPLSFVLALYEVATGWNEEKRRKRRLDTRHHTFPFSRTIQTSSKGRKARGVGPFKRKG
uniref:Uncharacterized protein n=1 Tax=Odontella aurita TaxID=265563 RepID=A0A7S4IND6_9STRA